ncbi:hypothetical protein Cco03nite_18580 [Catellatospora coxensis]|uniref:Uncharacterized protein n=1 Tax=Catellatospora coxensis TaxID=310354 RepID=A0A8J3KS18_9ACTN|nr:hypothetical protein Cco03nite_18580 [Catellatospora coxensis]
MDFGPAAMPPDRGGGVDDGSAVSGSAQTTRAMPTAQERNSPTSAAVEPVLNPMTTTPRNGPMVQPCDAVESRWGAGDAPGADRVLATAIGWALGTAR